MGELLCLLLLLFVNYHFCKLNNAEQFYSAKFNKSDWKLVFAFSRSKATLARKRNKIKMNKKNEKSFNHNDNVM